MKLEDWTEPLALRYNNSTCTALDKIEQKDAGEEKQSVMVAADEGKIEQKDAGEEQSTMDAAEDGNAKKEFTSSVMEMINLFEKREVALKPVRTCQKMVSRNKVKGLVNLFENRKGA